MMYNLAYQDPQHWFLRVFKLFLLELVFQYVIPGCNFLYIVLATVSFLSGDATFHLKVLVPSGAAGTEILY